MAVILMICVMLPFLFITFYEKDGLPFEKYAKFIYQHKVYQSHERRKEVNLEETKTTRTKIGTTKEAAPKGQKGAKKRR
ncbi:PrgI family protein [Streptococcus pyogenes]